MHAHVHERCVRVVDTTDAPSWSSARLLADLGADVIRVDTRATPLGPLAATRHVNKRSVVCDDQQLRELLAEADIWFDSGSSGVDVTEVRTQHPQLVKTLGSAALTIALAKMANRMRG